MVTYNIWNFNSNWYLRKFMIAETINREQPDVVGWQEIRYLWDDPFSNQLEQLASLIPGYQLHYQPAMYYPEQQTEEGLGIFIRDGIKILHHHYVQLPLLDCSDRNQRIALAMMLVLEDSRKVYFVDTHWSYARECQLSNALETWSFVKNFEADTYIVGDLNAYEDYKAPVDFLCGKYNYKDQTGNFGDIWSTVHRNESGFTFKVWLPETRADRMLQRGEAASKIYLVGAKQDMTQYASDHFGIVAVVSEDS